jgi:hypothetical protein
MAQATNDSIEAAGKVTVTKVTLDPQILITGDVGTVTFTIENTGKQNVDISDAQLSQRR